MTQALQTARYARAVKGYQKATAAGRQRKARQWKRRANRDLQALSLASFVAYLNKGAKGFKLMGATEWRKQGVTTAAELARVLDAEHRRNMEKERFSD